MPIKPLTHFQRMNRRATYDYAYEQKRKSSPELHRAKVIRSSSQWKKVRRFFLRRNPLCVDPFHVHKKMSEVVPAKEVHHMVALVNDVSVAFDPDNLMALCTGCHSKMESSK